MCVCVCVGVPLFWGEEERDFSFSLESGNIPSEKPVQEPVLIHFISFTLALFTHFFFLCFFSFFFLTHSPFWYIR